MGMERASLSTHAPNVATWVTTPCVFTASDSGKRGSVIHVAAAYNARYRHDNVHVTLATPIH